MDKNLPEFRIIALGDSGVGKTSIFKRYANNKFDEDTLSTIGLAFANKELTLKNKEKVSLKLVDTGGQEKYKAITKSYYKNANGVLFVFSHIDKDSFDHIKEWIKLFDENCNDKDIPKFLIGNKNDLKKFDEEESFDDFIQQHKILRYISTSAKDNKKNNISEIFKDMSEIINKTYKTSDKQYKLEDKDKDKDKNKNKNKVTYKCCGPDNMN